jgi:hypothetical protein
MPIVFLSRPPTLIANPYQLSLLNHLYSMTAGHAACDLF